MLTCSKHCQRKNRFMTTNLLWTEITTNAFWSKINSQHETKSTLRDPKITINMTKSNVLLQFTVGLFLIIINTIVNGKTKSSCFQEPERHKSIQFICLTKIHSKNHYGAKISQNKNPTSVNSFLF